MGIFSERDRMAQEAARNSPDKRDELIEELVDSCKLALRDFDSGGKHHLSAEAAGSLRASIAKAEREGYGQAGGEE